MVDEKDPEAPVSNAHLDNVVSGLETKIENLDVKITTNVINEM